MLRTFKLLFGGSELIVVYVDMYIGTASNKQIVQQKDKQNLAIIIIITLNFYFSLLKINFSTPCLGQYYCR